MRKSKSGFTIVELLVVVVIIGILVGVTLVIYRGFQGRARDSQRKTDVANIQKALELYYSDNGTYPIGSGTTSVVNSTWYTSGDSSWTAFATVLSSAIDTLPTDPTNSANKQPFAADGYVYGYSSGAYCGRANGQWYILVYRLEGAKERQTVGDCTTNPWGDGYYTSFGNSYVRVGR